MNRPSAFTYLIGNPLSLIALWLLAALAGYRWYAGDAEIIWPVIAALAAISAANANGRLNKYRLWKRDWEAMNGVVTTGTIIGDLMLRPVFRVVAGGAIWLAMAYGALTLASQPGMKVATALFWLGTLLLVCAGAFRWARLRWTGARQTRRVGDVLVAVCVAIPRQSPTTKQAFGQLPDYCFQLYQAHSSSQPNKS